MIRKYMYQDLKVFIKGKWLNIALMILVIGFIKMGMNSILIGNSLNNFLRELFYAYQYNLDIVSILTGYLFSGGNLFGNFVINLFSLVANYTLIIVIKNAYKDKKEISFSEFYIVLKDNIASLIIYGIIVAALLSLFSFIPFLSTFITYLTSFGPLIISEHNTDTINGFKESMTLGLKHIGHLILISFHYGFRMLSGMPLIFIGFYMMMSAAMNFNSIMPGVVIFLLGILITAALSIYYLPYITSTYPVYYCLLQEETKANEA